MEFKNILIITTGPDDRGSQTAFVEDLKHLKLTSVEDEDMEIVRSAIETALTLKEGFTVIKGKGRFHCSKNHIESEGYGYIFSGQNIGTHGKLPLTVEHIIDYQCL